MADYRFTSAPISFNGKKVAEISGQTTSIDSGDEDMFGQDGHLGASEGIAMMSVDCDMVVPVAGLSVPMLITLINKKTVTLGVLVDGKWLQSDVRVRSIKYTSDSKAGTTRCTATMVGPEPTIS